MSTCKYKTGVSLHLGAVEGGSGESFLSGSTLQGNPYNSEFPERRPVPCAYEKL